MSENNHHGNLQNDPFSSDEAAKLSEVSIITAALCISWQNRSLMTGSVMWIQGCSEKMSESQNIKRTPYGIFQASIYDIHIKHFAKVLVEVVACTFVAPYRGSHLFHACRASQNRVHVFYYIRLLFIPINFSFTTIQFKEMVKDLEKPASFDANDDLYYGRWLIGLYCIPKEFL